MNIFVTSECPIESAYNLAYRHIVKMVTEGQQMLSTAHHIIDGKDAPEGLYKATHVNHPCNIWIRESSENYLWLLRHTEALSDVYTMKSGKIHGAMKKCSGLTSELPRGILKGSLTPFAVAMDDDLKSLKDSISEKYRKYLNRKYSEWLTRDKPMKVEFPVAIPHWIDYDVLKLMEIAEEAER